MERSVHPLAISGSPRDPGVAACPRTGETTSVWANPAVFVPDQTGLTTERWKIYILDLRTVFDLRESASLYPPRRERTYLNMHPQRPPALIINSKNINVRQSK